MFILEIGPVGTTREARASMRNTPGPAPKATDADTARRASSAPIRAAARAARPSIPPRSVAALALVLVIAGAAIFGRAVDAPFAYRDVVLRGAPLEVATLGRLPDVLTATGVPRRVALERYLGGMHALGHPVVSVVIHVINGLLLFVLSATLLFRLAPALPPPTLLHSAALGSLLWFVHPVQTQAVSSVDPRASLCALFYLSALVLCLCACARVGRARVLLLAGAFTSGLLALGTRENAATLPLFAALVCWLAFPRRLDRRSLAVLLLAGVCLLAIAWIFTGPSWSAAVQADPARTGFTPWQRTITEARVVMHDLTLLAYPAPSRLNADYDVPLSSSLPSPPTTALSLLLIGAAAVIAVAGLKRWPLPALAVLWFLGHLAFESSLIPLDLVYEHRLYLPSMIPIVFATAFVLSAAGDRPRVRAWLLGAAAFLACASFPHNAVWRSPVEQLADNAHVTDQGARAREPR
jgi:hypothetical protein